METAEFFGDFLTECEHSISLFDSEAISIPESDIRYWEDRWGFSDSPSSEFGLAVYHTCNYLLKRKCVIFHAAAFLWKGKAYLLTAPSGTGKTTQLINWLTLDEEDIVIINGDKPALKVEESGKVHVYSSPWKGKERWGTDHVKAPLAGIIVLQQGEKNSIRKLTIRESVSILLQRFLFIADTKELVLAAASVEDALIRAVPVWQLTNKGDLESTLLTRETLVNEMENRYGFKIS